MARDGVFFAIGDIHGQSAFLDHALDLIARDPAAGSPIVFLGDYVDRGPDSFGVLQRLCDARADGAPWHLLMGNHDRFMLHFLTGDGQDGRHHWLDPAIGGRSTLTSYGVDASEDRATEAIREDARRAVPKQHLSLLNGLSLSWENARYFCVHAGIRPGVPFDAQSEDDLLWIRREFLEDTRDHGKIVVHGHTPVEAPMHCGNRINLDSGAGYGYPLTAALFEGDRVWTLNDGGRAPLEPPAARRWFNPFSRS